MSTVHVAIPVQDEVDCLPRCIDALRTQRGVRLVVWACVNQPDGWHLDPTKQAACESNRICLRILSDVKDLDVHVIDRASPGHGWPAKRGGVGHARKQLMDEICTVAAPRDVIVSLDADTTIPSDYLYAVVEAFARHPTACGLAARYFHPLTQDDAVTRAMLGYEIYMRFYALNMWRIQSPYSFTALGSAMALPVDVYRRVGGIAPRTGGEDFYFLQKLAKYGRVLHWSDGVVHPGTRKSWRVPVGTGQAIAAACEGKHRDRYPLYRAELFDNVRQTTELFRELFAGSVETPLDRFLRQKTNTRDPWQSLRENHSTPGRFVRACHERLDGLRILQYLKSEYRKAPSDDRATFTAWLDRHGSLIPGAENEAAQCRSVLGARTFNDLNITELDGIRRMLFDMEDSYRRRADVRD